MRFDTVAAVDQARLIAVARQLESTLVRSMFDAMQQAQLENGGFFGQGAGSQGMQATFDLYLSQALATGRGLGLSTAIAQQLEKNLHPSSSGASGPATFSSFQLGAQVSSWLADERSAKESAATRSPIAEVTEDPR